MDLILGVAQRDERIRAVYMTGSRANPDAPKDIFQDYDVVYVVEETASLIREKNWIRVFGDLLMLQEPDKNDKLDVNVDFDRSYAYLMLFADEIGWIFAFKQKKRCGRNTERTSWPSR